MKYLGLFMTALGLTASLTLYLKTSPFDSDSLSQGRESLLSERQEQLWDRGERRLHSFLANAIAQLNRGGFFLP